MSGAILGGPMFEPAKTEFWESDIKGGAHYNVYGATSTSMEALRKFFPNAEADEMNFCLFSTSGVHGEYTTIEEVENGLKGIKDEDGYCPDEVTFLIVQPRIVCTRWGNVKPENQEDIDFLKKLRESSWKAVQTIGKPDENE